MIVDELITLLKFDVDGMSNAEAFDTVLSSIEERSKEIVLGLTGVIASVGFFADRVSKAVAENYEWAKSNGVAADSYQRFEHAAAIVGGSLDDMKGDLEGWVRSAKASGQTLEEVFLRETDSIKEMTTEQSHALLKARGYSDTSIKLIQQGEGKLKEFLAQAQVIPEENIRAAEDYAKTWREVSSQVTQLMTSAVASALPALRGVLETIRAFVQRNKELVKSTVAAFFKSVAIAVKILFTALSPLIRGIELLLKIFDLATFGIGKYIIIIGALTAAFVALGVAATVKAVKGIALLMGNISKMIGITGKAIGYLAEMSLNIEKNGVKQTFLNSRLAAGVKLWWLDTKARMRSMWAASKTIATTWAHIAAQKAQALATAFQTTTLGGYITAVIAATKATWSWTVALLANPATWIVLAVVAAFASLGVTIYAIIKYWDDIVAAIDWCWQKIKAFFSWWGSLTVKFWSGVWNKITGFASKIWGIFVGTITKLWNFLSTGVQNFLKGVYSKVTGVVKNIWNKITSVFSKIGSFFSNPFKDIWESATGVIDKVWNSIKGFCSKVSETVKQAFSTPIDFILGLLTSAINFAIDGINVIVRALSKLPGVDISEIDHVDLRIKDRKEEDEKREKEQPPTLSQKEQSSAHSVVQKPIIEQSTMSQEPGQSGADRLARILNNVAPANSVAVPVAGVATATPTQVANNNQRSASYVDQRNITINTNATSGPAIANHLRGTNDMMSSGIGMAGAY